MSSVRSPKILALLVAGAFFMEFLDGTVIATAIPRMAVTFHVRPVDLGLGMSAYLLTVAVLLPLSGWVAQRFGVRLVFSAALAGFTAASLLCAVSNDITFFVGARILQGAAGAMMVPVGRLAVLRTTAKKDLMRAIATLTWPALAAPIIAPPLGGFATTYLSWRWVFLINIPFGIIGLVLARWYLPTGRSESAPPLDWAGFILTGLGCLGVMTGVELLGAPQVDWGLTAGCLAGGVVSGVLAVRTMRRRSNPLLNFSVLRVRSFSASVVGGSLFRIVISTVPFLLPLLFQVGFGYDAFTSGLLVLPLFVGNMLIKPMTSRILRRWGFRNVLIGNGLLAASTIAACAAITLQTPLPLTIAILFVSGVARSMQLTAINTIAFAEVPDAGIGNANTLFNTVQQISLGLGVVVGVLALRVGQILLPSGSPVATPAQFRIAFLLIGVLAIGATIDAFGLTRETGLHVSRG